MLIYMDNCCYNRPYDDQSQKRIADETKAVMFIQNEIMHSNIELVSSFILYAENFMDKNTFRRLAVRQFMDTYSSVHVSSKNKKLIDTQAMQLMNLGLHYMDACHVACAVLAGCDYFLSTDDRLIKELKRHSLQTEIMNPVDFVKRLGVTI